MFSSVINHIRAFLAFFFYVLNSLIFVPMVLFMAILKFCLPFDICQKGLRLIITEISNCWIGINNLNMKIFQDIDFEVSGLEDLSMNDWYLVISNHQSWVDILVLQKVLKKKIPFLKFFLKKELIWVPVMGLAWWALEFPFMKRYSKKFIEKNPHLKGKDIEITKKACQKYKSIPVSVVNFVEGTRFTKTKHKRQQSPFNKLLKPKAGGIAFVLDSMGEMMTAVVNVTIVYPFGVKSFFQYLKGDLKKVKVHIEVIPVTEEHLGDYTSDITFKTKFQEWVNSVWEQKDQRINEMLGAESD